MRNLTGRRGPNRNQNISVRFADSLDRRQRRAQVPESAQFQPQFMNSFFAYQPQAYAAAMLAYTAELQRAQYGGTAGMAPPMSPIPPIIAPQQQFVPSPAPHQVSLFVCHIPLELDETQLYALFSRYGAIASVKIIRHPQSGKSKGYGFVNMLNDKDAEHVYMVIFLLGLYYVGHCRAKQFGDGAWSAFASVFQILIQ